MKKRLALLLPLLALPASAQVAAAPDDLPALAKAIDATPDDPKSYEAYGTKALNLGKLDEGIAKLKIGVARVADFGSAYYLLAYAYRKKQVWADAADYYRRCIALKQKENESYFGLGQSLAGLGDKRGALAALKHYVAQEKRPTAQKFVDQANQLIAQLEPPTVSPAELRAEADKLRNEKKFEEAAAAYRKAIEADKGNLSLYNDLGNVFFALKRYDDAAAAFKGATDRDPHFALGWYNLAHAYRRGERRSQAVEAYMHYTKLKPDDPDPYYGLGQTLKALGDAQGAVSAFRKYVEMEKRPEEQKWVEKARQELSALELTLRPAPPPPEPSGKVIDEK